LFKVAALEAFLLGIPTNTSCKICKLARRTDAYLLSHHPVAADIAPETATHGIDIFIRTKGSYPKSCCYLFDRVEHLKYERGGEAPLHAYRRPRRFRHR
jgi:hypothetical protein